MTCAQCGGAIDAKRARYKNRYGQTKYCSPRCNKEAYNARKASSSK